MSQIKNPKVTVLINNYNYGRYLDKAIESALQQTYKNTEILVVDDGSTDNSPEVMKRYGKFITPVFKSNGGQASAVNKGFDSITGDYVFFLDADDYWDINKIEKCMEVFHMNKACGYVHHNMKVIDEKDHIIDLLKKDKLSSGWLAVDKAFSLNYTFSPMSAIAMKKSTLNKIMPICEDIFKIRADYYLQTVSTLFTEICSLDEPLAFYRIHGNNCYSGYLSEQKMRMDIDLMFSFCTYIMERFNTKVDLDSNYYYVRNCIFFLRSKKKFNKAYMLMNRYVRALTRTNLNARIKIRRLAILCIFFLQHNVGLYLFNKIIFRRRQFIN